MSAPPEAIWNGWRKIGQGVPSDYGRLLAEGKFEDMLVATKYTVTSGGATVLECLGAYAQFFCSKPEAK